MLNSSPLFRGKGVKMTDKDFINIAIDLSRKADFRMVRLLLKMAK